MPRIGLAGYQEALVPGSRWRLKVPLAIPTSRITAVRAALAEGLAAEEAGAAYGRPSIW